ncbi:Protein translocase subunit SecDF (plasmid) [Pseudoseohaeicola sp. NH-UV-7]|uniref:protein translocase subunit SecD n=1 Tax=Sulfitobacter sp. TBRI5 TaxID=2989732 RepID=UPI003A654C03
MKTPVWRFVLYAIVILVGIALALPTFLPRETARALPAWLPDRPVALGIDLRGGASLTLQADETVLVDEMLADARAEIGEALEAAGLAVHLKIEGQDLVISPREPNGPASSLRTAVESALPTFQRGALSATEPAFYLTEANAGTLRLALRNVALEAAQSDAMAQSIEVVRKRVDEAGVAEPSIQRLGTDRILVQMPGVSDPSALRSLLGSTAELTFHRLAPDPGGGRALAADTLRLPMADGSGSVVVDARHALDGERLADASAAFSPETGAPVVHFRFDTQGAVIFGELTQALVGQPFAIVLDGKVLSAPVIREPILGGSGEISGDFTIEETTTLSALLRAGALPVPLEVIEERTVGADLGADAITGGLWTGLAGFGLVAAVLILLYGGWGLVATGALLLNVVLTIAALTLLGATLTLPGIAGLILGMGLAVDANVLINERIREETARGKRAASAVQAGFDRAYRAILDSNLTTFIATALLFWLGSGPVKGFAVTMGLGILISLFTAVTVVRSAMDIYLRTRKPKTFEIRAPLGFLRAKATPTFRFMRMRFAGLGLSLVLSVASLVLFVTPGLNYGVDFRGGTLVEAHFSATPDVASIRTSVEALELGDVSLQQSDWARSLLIRVEEQPGGEAAQTRAADQVRAAVTADAPDASFERVEIVGPRVSAELAVAGILAVGAASLAMLIYIWARFDWPFAVGAIATLALDITKTVGFFALTGLDFGLTAIAALLTLIGYSVNDKVVVYDRMRENIGLHPTMPLRELIDLSINQTLARSLYTSVTALVAMLPMAIWGGAAVQSFAIPMAFGIVIAAGSSVFIAAPILLFLGDWRSSKSADATLVAAEHSPT